jgi:asparagine synthase (glutamine-hydrolysing)
MCGIAFALGKYGPRKIKQTIASMMRVQSHRGPDGSGEWYGHFQGVDIGLGHLRLKILDLSDASRQPMESPDSRFRLIYNGEIYNYLELREQLEAAGVTFATAGDTEVLLQALIVWGTAAFARLNGMWAFVLLDMEAGTALLARDRFGVKPLYTYTDHEGLLAASEIKAILAASGRRFRVNETTVNAFLTQSLLCATPETFFQGVQELPAGHFATVSLAGSDQWQVNPESYFNLPAANSPLIGPATLIDEVRNIFVDSVRLRLRSDVPLGVLLSGGIDSSAIAGVVHALNPGRDDITLLSAVDPEGKEDEQPFIDIVANYLHRPVEKVALDYRPDAAFDLMSKVSWLNDEPVGSFSTVAYYLLMERARSLGVTVLLSGQGADENLCGYNKFMWFYVQELAAKGRWSEAIRTLFQFCRNGVVVPEFTYQEAKRYLPPRWRLPEIDVRGRQLRGQPGSLVSVDASGVVGRQLADIQHLSVPALVHYEDRMSMAFAREIRLPFLDYRFVGMLAPLSPEYKLHNGWTKWIFRKAMEPFLPPATVWRRDKKGFLVPQTNWLRQELQRPIRQILAENWLTEYLGLIDPRQLQRRYDQYLRQGQVLGRVGEKDIFFPLALELWARRFESYLTN